METLIIYSSLLAEYLEYFICNKSEWWRWKYLKNCDKCMLDDFHMAKKKKKISNIYLPIILFIYQYIFENIYFTNLNIFL